MLPAICTLYIVSAVLGTTSKEYYIIPTEEKCNHTILSNLFKVTHLKLVEHRIELRKSV